MNLELLAEPFPAEDIEWRVQTAGGYDNRPWAQVLAYVTNRAIQQRLDDVCDPECWRNEYDKAPDGGVLCGIAIYVADRKEWVTKYDGAPSTDIEAVKGGLSNAMKRAAVQWGIGRYLYSLDTNFVSLVKDKPTDMTGWGMLYDKDSRTRYYWKHPKLPAWALPTGSGAPKPLKEDEDYKPTALQKQKIKDLTAQLGIVRTIDDHAEWDEFALNAIGATDPQTRRDADDLIAALTEAFMNKGAAQAVAKGE